MIPEGPRCLRWWMVKPSGPAAREVPLSRMAFETESIENLSMDGSSGWVLRRLRLVRRVSGSDL